MHRRFTLVLRFVLLFLIVGGAVLQPQSSVYALTTLTVEPLTWNVIGLDSNDVSVGPNHFPVGARVCNSGSEAATNVTASFQWDSSDPYIALRPGTLTSINLGTLNAGSCADAYFEAQVTRNSSAYDHTRDYHIEVTAGNVTGTISTPTPRELYVEHLISQSRNAVTDVQLNGVSVAAGGTMTLMVGQTYEIKLVGFTATQGYEQIEYFINFPNTIFQILSVTSTFSADTSVTVGPSPIDMLYGDNCIWDNDPNSPTYRACLSTGKTGGNISTTYQVRILQVPGAPLVNPQPLSTLIYDFSGSSYHYNSDFGVSTRFANIVNASITKSFSPKTINPGSPSTLTFTVNNPGPSAISGVNFTDDLPAGMTLVNNSVTYSGCGAALPATVSDPLSFSNITVAGLGTCTVAVNVTTSTDGTYNNTSGNLFINTSTDTGSFATDSLVVSSQPPPPASCASPVTLASWTMPTSGQGSGGPPPPYTTKATDVSSATASAVLTAAGSQSTNTAGLTTNAWGITDAWPSVAGAPGATAAPYFDFVVDTSNYGGVRITFDRDLEAPGDWGNATNSVYIYSSADGGAFSAATPFTTTKGSWQTGATATAATTGASTTRFTIHADTRNAAKATSTVYLDNIVITGCQRPSAPTLSKSFSPTTIARGSASTLTFTFTNPNSTALSEISFSDALPTGLVVNTPNGLSAISCSAGSVVAAPAITAAAGTSTISMNGLQLSANASCSFSVSVKGDTAGAYTNISQSITSTSSGPNTTATGYGTSSLTVIDQPVLAKSFTANPIFTGNTTALDFDIVNPNASTALTGVTFTDVLPAGLSVADGTFSVCGGTNNLTTNAATRTITLLNTTTIAAGAACSFSVTVTGSSAGSYTNTTGNISSTNGGTGNTASANVLVKTPAPAINLLKQVGSAATGPWTSFMTVSAGSNVYYRFTVENTGDVSLSNVSVDDPTVSTTACSWTRGDGATPVTSPFTLPVADAANNHIATCVLGPITAVSGSHTNTATASGTSGSTVTESSSATYGTPAITIAKSVTETSFTAAGDVLNYTYLVTNSGDAPLLGPVTVTDDRTTVTCPAVTTVGDNDAWFDEDESLTCMASYTVVAADVTAGSVTNTAFATVNGVTSTNDSETVYGTANLAITKDDGVTSVNAGATTTYTIRATNNGPSSVTGAILSDLAAVGLSKTAVACSATPGQCTAGTTPSVAQLESGTFALPALASGQFYEITVTATVTATSGTVTNTATIAPPAGGNDPDLTNNTASDTDTVIPAPDLTVTKTNNTANGIVASSGTFQWTITVQNGAGVGTASFADGNVILSDTLPAGPAYGAVTVTNGATAPTGTINCSTTGTTLNCVASGGPVTLPAGASFSATFNVTPAAAGSLVNTVTVDPNGVVTESNEANNNGSNTVHVVNVAKTIVSTSEASTGFLSGFERVVVGEIIRYRLTTSLPEGTWTNVQVTDAIETGIQFLNDGTATISYVCDGPCTNSTFNITPAAFTSSTDPTFNLGTVSNPDNDANAESMVIEFNVLVLNMASNSAGGVTKNNTYTISFDGAAITSPAIGVRVSEPAITDLAKAVSPAAGPYYPADTITYTLTYSNGSTGVSRATAYDVFLTDTVSANLNLQSVAVTAPTGSTVTDTSTTGVGGGVRVLVNQVAPAADITSGPTGVTVTVVAQIVNSAPAGTLSNTASLTYTSLPGGVTTGDANGTCPNVTGSCLPAGGTSGAQTGERNGTGGAPNTYTDTASVDITVTQLADLSLTKTVNNPTPNVGSNVTFTITVTNAGPSNATNVAVSDVLPAGLAYVSSAPSQGSYDSGTGIWAVGNINSGANATLDIVATVTSAGAKNNYAQISAVDQTDPDSTPNDNSTTEDDDDTVTVTPVATAVLSDFVWNDLDGDGVQDGGLEVGLAGVRVYVDLDGDNSYDIGEPTGTTNASGNYSITGLAAGTYAVRVDTTTLPAGFNATFDLDGANDNEASVTVAAGETRTDIDFGYQQQNAVISDFIWNDLDGDGLQDGGPEVGLAGVRVYVDLDGDNAYDIGEPTGTTNASGNYIITGLAAGTYAVRVDTTTLPAGFNPTFDLDGGNDNEASVTVTAGQTRTDIDFGYQPQAPDLMIVKTLDGNADEDGSGTVSVNDTLTYSVTVTNVGNTTLTNVVVSDTLITPNSTTCASVTPGDTCVLTGTYVVTQTDVDNGQIDNTGSVTDDDVCTNVCTDPHTELVPQSPAITLAKTGTLNDDDSTPGLSAGDTIMYAFTVTNSGNVTLTSITLSDTVGGVTINGGPIASLAPGASDNTTFTGSYTLTQADIDAGTFSNTATVTGTPPSGPNVSDPDDDTQTLTGIPALTIVKTSNATGTNAVGDTITYTYDVENTGNLTLTNVTVTDAHAGLSAITCTPAQGSTLLPGETMQCTATYTVTQVDVDSGRIDNTGVVTGTPPTGPNVTDNDPLSEPVAQNPAITIVKNSDANGANVVGDVITYTYDVENTGNVTLTNVTVTDAHVGLSAIICTPAQGSTLLPGATMQCTATYTVTQADVDAGQINNTGVVTGTPPSGPDVTANDPLSEPVAQNPSLVLAKIETSTGPYALNDTITYSVTATNTGNTTLTNLVVSDPNLTPNSVACAAIAPLGTCVLSGSYTVTQADLDAGSFTNTGSVTDDDVCPAAGPATCEDNVTVNFTQTPELTIVKSETSTGPYALNDTITYSVVVTNTGNVTLTNVLVSDPNLTPNSNTCASVAPLGTCVLNGSYTVTQSDVDAGSFTNTASVTDDDVCPAAGAATCEDNVTVNFTQSPALTIAKSETSTGPYAVSDTISYDIVVTNTGNTTLTNVVVSDPDLTPNSFTCASLAPGAPCTLSGVHTVTQSDVDAGSFTNTGSVTDNDVCPAAGAGTCEDAVTVTFTPAPALSVAKSETSTGPYAVGDAITYDVVVTNTGNTTLTNVVVSDPNLTPNSITCASVAPSGTCTLSGSYTVTQVDIDAGSFSNTGSVTDDDVCPAAGSATCEDTVIVNFPQNPDLTIAKSETSTGPYAVGDTITYEVVVTNTGNTTLSNVVVSDPNLTPNSTTCASLTPLGTCTLTGSYTVQQSDLDAGSFSNTGSVTDDDVCPAAGAVTCEDMVIVNFPQNPDLTITKTVTSTGPYTAGDTITYDVVVTNTGNITLTNVVVGDPDLTPNSTTCASLAPLGTCTLTGSYTVQPADVTAGNFTNTASVTDNDVCPAAGAATCQDSVTVPISAALVVDPAISKAGSPTQATVGETVTFTLVVTNQGNTPAPNVVITDVLPSIFDVTAVNVTGAPLGTLVNVTPPIGTGPAPYTVVVTLGADLGVSDVVTIRIVTTVNGTGNPPITNTATLTTSALTDVIANNADSATITIRNSTSTMGSVLPATGFAPNVVTDLSNVPHQMYTATGNVTLEIPSLNVKIPVVGVPKKDGTWNVSWLGNQAGWLEGSAFPSWNGNSVLTSHVYLSNGLPGPFVNLGTLKYGDNIVIHAYGQKYTFEVRENKIVEPNYLSVMKHEEKSWLTLVTCKEYDPKTNTYRKRVVVRAVLVSVTR